MLELMIPMVETMSEAAVLLDRGTVVACSPMARHYLPHLRTGLPAPDCLPQARGAVGGLFSAGLSAYSYTLSPLGQAQLLIFRPAPQTAITDTQLDGALRQLRQFMGEFLMELPQQPGPEGAPFRKSFYRLFRLLGNLEYLHQPDRPISRGPLDLAGLCHQIVQQAAPLLAQGGIELDYDCPDTSLIIPGDPVLLQRMILELIANSARAARGGSIHLRLRHQGGKALLTLSDTGAPPTQRQLAAMLQQDADQNIPAPGAGAGLGLPIVRRIVAAHQGAMLVEWGQGSPSTLISLPTGPLEPRTTLGTPTACRDGGLSPLLTALADVLPAEAFELAELD